MLVDKACWPCYNQFNLFGRDVFGLSLFFSDLWSPSAALDDQELYIQCLMEKGSLFLEYKGKTHRTEKEEDIRKVISVYLRDIPLDKEYTENALWETDSEKEIPRGRDTHLCYA